MSICTVFIAYCNLCPFLVYKLKMDEALLKFYSELPYIVSVYYTSDYCYKVFQHFLSSQSTPQEYVQVELSCIKCFVSIINLYLISNNIII